MTQKYLTAQLSAAETVQVEDSIDTIFEEYYKNGWTDGLPIIPPTKDRVAEMMTAVNKAPDDVVATLPPRMGNATVKKIAINAVIAGCLPAYMPVIVAAVEAIADPEFNLKAHAVTTSPIAIMLLVNGPIRKKLDINSSWGVFGPGWRANATIGRAINLVILNVGGRIPGEVCKSVVGNPGRYTMCIGENEEDSPWEPLHVTKGFHRNESTVTAIAAAGWHDWEHYYTDIQMLGAIVMYLHAPIVASVHPIFGQSEYYLVINPAHAKVFAQAGYSKQSFQKYLYDHVQDLPTSIMPDYLFQELIAADRGELKFWQDRDVMVREGKIAEGQRQITSKGFALVARPDQLQIIVSGADSFGSGGCIVPTWLDGHGITRPIKD